MDNPINEFLEIVDDIYGLFIDSTQGFLQNLEKINQGQRVALKATPIKTIEELDKITFFYGQGNPNDPNTKIIHTCTQGKFKERNSRNGKNTIVIGNLCLCQIYNYWEDYYRKNIASYLGITKNELRSDIFGDLRYYRQSIIHKQGLAIKNVENAKIIQWYNYNDEIKIDEDKFARIVYEVKNYLRTIQA